MVTANLNKKQNNGVRSAAYVPFQVIVASVAVMNGNIKPYMASKGNTQEEVVS